MATRRVSTPFYYLINPLSSSKQACTNLEARKNSIELFHADIKLWTQQLLHVKSCKAILLIGNRWHTHTGIRETHDCHRSGPSDICTHRPSWMPAFVTCASEVDPASIFQRRRTERGGGKRRHVKQALSPNLLSFLLLKNRSGQLAVTAAFTSALFAFLLSLTTFRPI